MEPQESVTRSLAFLLGKLGQTATSRFADRLAPLGLRPRHCAVLELLSPAPLGQLALAQAVGVTPSVVVDMLDELEAVGALRRVRDSADRRRQIVEITDDGRALALSAARLAEQVDAELLDALDPAQATALREILVRVATAQGLPVTQAAPGGGRTAAPSG
ncbi:MULTISPECIES: MarR family winged helix-turn-helix transcriptional regulator [Streptosporangium]|uniref:DNA-binding MarR family transcriptional regulator n=1 Tax=Streptosporangium brasiliense TaxID=47480 RepID=A0ABT9RBB2_9ACTN|nr:MarR family winged helix-turn-helix transcriptional regulator [Streptosporangium brasiliense]MDP9866438.1 DNA-binding MarR family transcriptional regulator [Streptosporangium brasiliense]